jgi:hypothetical protein
MSAMRERAPLAHHDPRGALLSVSVPDTGRVSGTGTLASRLFF